MDKSNFVPSRWIHNQNYEWGNVSVDKISLALRNSDVNIFFKKSYMRSVSISKVGDYYTKINIHAEHINQQDLLILQINNVLSLLYLEGFFRSDIVPEAINKIVKLSELEIAFNMPKRRVNFPVAYNIFHQFMNSFYSRDYNPKQSKDSLVCLYDRSLKTGNKIHYADSVFRFEYRLKRQELKSLVPGGERTLMNCSLLFQTPSKLINSLEKPLTFLTKRLNIPYNLFNTYKNYPLLERIMSGNLL